MKQLIKECGSAVEVLDNIDIMDVARSKCSYVSGREDVEDGFYLCDLGNVVQKHLEWLKKFPKITPFYAIKCNPSELLLKTMLSMGTGFDCASKKEIEKMLGLGASPDKIIFANPCKQSSHIKFARDNGVEMMVFDSEIELYKIKKIYPRAKLLLRIQTDDSASVCKFSMKYGAHPDSLQILVDTAKELDLNLIGVSFHVGSGCQDAAAFLKAIQLARIVFDYGMLSGYDMDLLDIGGGFPGTSNATISFEKIAEVVNAAIEDIFFSHPKFSNLRVIAEPGRYYAASAFTLLTNVIAKKKTTITKKLGSDDTSVKDNVLRSLCPSTEESGFMYFLNDGLYGAFNCLFFDHAEVKPILLENDEKKCVAFNSSIWGPTCDGLDKILDSVSLPELETGDWIVWKDMGAYTLAAGSAFNGFKTTAVYYVISSDNQEMLKSLMLEKIPGASFACGTNKSKNESIMASGELVQ